MRLARRLGGPLRRENRVTYVEWLDRLLNMAVNSGWRIFYLGSKPGVADRGAALLRGRFPALQIATAQGYFDCRRESPENHSVLKKIYEYRPHMLLVGMGMPRQESWILDNRDLINATIVMPVGALIDYVAGEIFIPPRWSGRVGLEWLFRLLSQPSHLWRRYLIEPWFLLGLVVAETFAKRIRKAEKRVGGHKQSVQELPLPHKSIAKSQREAS